MQSSRRAVLFAVGVLSWLLYLANLPATMLYPSSRPWVGLQFAPAASLVRGLTDWLWTPPRVWLLVLVWLSIWGLYLAALRVARGLTVAAVRPIVWPCMLAGIGLMLFTPGQNSTDIYFYAYLGRLGAVHGQDPYLTAWPSDYFYRIAPTAAAYPPVLTGLFTLAVRLAGPDPLADVLCIKLLMMGFLVAAVWQFDRWLASCRPHAGGLLVLLAWNPVVLWELASEGHNEAVGLFLVVGFVRAWLAERRVAAAGWLLLLALTKQTLLALVGFYLLTLVRDRAWRVLGWTAAGLAAGAAAVILPLGGLAVLRTGRLASLFITSCPLALGYVSACLSGHPNEFMRYATAARTVMVGLWGVLYLVCSQRRGPPMARLSWLYLGFFMFASPVVEPWYLPVCLALAAMAPDGPAVPLALFFTLMAWVLAAMYFTDIEQHLQAVSCLYALVAGVGAASMWRWGATGGQALRSNLG